MTYKDAIMQMGKTGMLAALALGLVLVASNNPSWAGSFAQQHPRRAEVLRRDAGLNRQINGDRGELGGQYRHLESEDAAIRRQEQRDARLNGGYITQAQQAQLNREETGLQRQINHDDSDRWFERNHPRRDQVLDRDASLNRRISADRGDLGGHYWQLKQEDRSIRQQEQADARVNGGYITPQQQQQLNQEEAALRNQINQDYHP